MEETKYYQPTINEFRVGFEYQRNEDGWYNTTIDTSWQLVDYVRYLERFGFSDTRVKYLDKEDIESLGWTFKGKNEENKMLNFELIATIPPKDIRQDIRSNNWNLRIETDNRVFIRQGANWTRFLGIIKNKSELRVLMNQLNIAK